MHIIQLLLSDQKMEQCTLIMEPFKFQYVLFLVNFHFQLQRIAHSMQILPCVVLEMVPAGLTAVQF